MDDTLIGQPAVSLDRIELLAALDHPGCPLCRVADDAGGRYLRHFLHEFVLDVGIRAKLHRAYGFCREHAWELQRLEAALYHDNMGTATVYEDLARGVARAIRAQAPSGRVAAGWLHRERERTSRPRMLAPTGPCPACGAALFKVGYLSELLVRRLPADEEVRMKFQNGFGLCLPHFRVALGVATSEEERRILVEVEAQKFEALAAQLDTYARRLSWNHRHEPIGEEQTSPVRAIELFVGAQR